MTNAVSVGNGTKKKRRKKRKRSRRRRSRERPTLRFTPYSWSKLLYLRDVGSSEVGGFGVSSAEDLLLVEDIRLVEQSCTAVTVEFDDAAVADFFDEQVDAGLRPEQFGRIWIHTHPGDCPYPSGTDEDTFSRCFSSADWAVMFMIAADSSTYARQQFNVGPGSAHRMRTEVDFDRDFAGTNTEAWMAEYLRNVTTLDPFQPSSTNRIRSLLDGEVSDIDNIQPDISDVINDWYERFEAVDLFSTEEQETEWDRYLAAVD